jgi:lipid-binding SYLF domain-containing protein
MLKNLVRITSLAALFCLVLGALPVLAGEKEDAEKKLKKQKAVLKMRDQALADLYKGQPEAEAKIKKAAGYAVFDSGGIHLFLLATSRGNGVAVDNGTKQPTYMKMKQVGAGPGLGVKDYRVVVIFKKAATMKKFMDSGWSFGGEADAAAKSKNDGGAAATSGAAGDMEIYTMTKKGIALQATLGGTKFSKDDELN